MHASASALIVTPYIKVSLWSAPSLSSETTKLTLQHAWARLRWVVSSKSAAQGG